MTSKDSWEIARTLSAALAAVVFLAAGAYLSNRFIGQGFELVFLALVPFIVAGVAHWKVKQYEALEHAEKVARRMEYGEYNR